jgi:hypothetical protein
MIELTQKERQAYYEQDKTMLFNYKRIYQIEFSHGVNEYILRELKGYRITKGLPYTKAGRYFANTPIEAKRFIERCV